MRDTYHNRVLRMVLSYFPNASPLVRERLQVVPARALLVFLDLLDSCKNCKPTSERDSKRTIELKL